MRRLWALRGQALTLPAFQQSVVQPLVMHWVRSAQKWAWAFWGLAVGAWTMSEWGASTLAQHAQALQQVQALHQAIQATPSPTRATPNPAALPSKPQAVSDALVDLLPSRRDVSSVWVALQHGLAQQGLQTHELRPLALQESVPLVSQSVALRLQGRYADGANAWASLVEAGPVWTWDRLTVVAGAEPGQLQWDGVWRVWLRSDAPSAQAWPAQWHVSLQRSAPEVLAKNPFGAVSASVNPPQALASEPRASPAEPTAVPADPRQWPMGQVRLLGVVEQGAVRQAVLGVAGHWVALGVGGRLGLARHRIQSIWPDAVFLQPIDSAGPVHVLRLKGDLQ